MVATSLPAFGTFVTATIRVGDATPVNSAMMAVTVFRATPLAFPTNSTAYVLSPYYAGAVHSLTMTGGDGVYSYSLVAGGDEWAMDETGAVSLVRALGAGASSRAVFLGGMGTALRRGLRWMCGLRRGRGLINGCICLRVWSTKGRMAMQSGGQGMGGIGLILPRQRRPDQNSLTGRQVVSYGGSLWVVGGDSDDTFHSNRVERSADGRVWVTVTATGGKFSPRSRHQMVAHGGSLWVVGGSRRNGAVYFNDVWRSADGADWVEVTVSGTKFAGREGHQMVSYGGSLWVVGGHVGGRDRSRYFDDVWRSADGAVWVEVPVSVPVSVSVSVSVTVSVTVSTAFAERSEHQMIAYGGSLWVVGGYDGRDYFDDVWRSADGAVWVEVPVDGEAFAGRSEHQMVSHDGLLWVIGGYDGGFFNDVWYSSDGRRWDSVPTAGARFKPQLGHQVVAHSPSFIYEVAEIVATVKAPRSVSSNSALPLTVATVVATGGSGALWFEVAADAKGVARIGRIAGRWR